MQASVQQQAVLRKQEDCCAASQGRARLPSRPWHGRNTSMQPVSHLASEFPLYSLLLAPDGVLVQLLVRADVEAAQRL
jgi:hypothetical protein